MPREKIIPNRDKTISTLKKKGRVVGEDYSIEALYKWKTGAKNPLSHKPSKYCLCKIEIFQNERIGNPIEYFEIEDIEKAVDKYLEAEYAE